jgi:hypothetical protein
MSSAMSFLSDFRRQRQLHLSVPELWEVIDSELRCRLGPFLLVSKSPNARPEETLSSSVADSQPSSSLVFCLLRCVVCRWSPLRGLIFSTFLLPDLPRCTALRAAAVAPIPNKVALRCSSEVFLLGLFVNLSFLVARTPKARSELVDDEDELLKLKKPFFLLCLDLFLLGRLEKKPVNMPSCWGENDCEAVADVRFCELVNPRI